MKPGSNDQENEKDSTTVDTKHGFNYQDNLKELTNKKSTEFIKRDEKSIIPGLNDQVSKKDAKNAHTNSGFNDQKKTKRIHQKSGQKT